MSEDWFKEAVRQRAEEAEARFQNDEPPEPEDVVVMALAHPEKFIIQVQARHNPLDQS